MVYYRLYLLGGAGHVETVREIEAVDDAAAVKVAMTGQGSQRMELWCGARFVEDWILAMPQRGSGEQYGATIERVKDWRPVPLMGVPNELS